MVNISLLDFLTGGESNAAQNALNNARQVFGNVQVPTAAQLTLPQLQQYVIAGVMTPAQAQAALIQSNAYNGIQVDPAALESQMKSLEQLGTVASQGGITPQMKAQLAEALNQVATQEHGANAAIEDQFAQRGIPTSLMAEANMRSEAANDANTANLTATQAAGQAEQNAINAMMNEGSLGGNIENELYGQAANKAAAQNAINQWNAGNRTNVSEANAARTQQANAYNTENAQNMANENTGLSNQRTEYNAQIPETIFNNQIQKASGEAGAYQNIASNAEKQANQNLDIAKGIVSAASPFMNFGSTSGGSTGTGVVNGMNVPTYAPTAAEMGYGAGIPFDVGGKVPGHAAVDGDSPKNDKVHAMLSPGEIVVPRSIAPHPEAVKRFVTHLIKNKPIKPVHPHDVATVLDALTARRNYAAA